MLFLIGVLVAIGVVVVVIVAARSAASNASAGKLPPRPRASQIERDPPVRSAGPRPAPRAGAATSRRAVRMVWAGTESIKIAGVTIHQPMTYVVEGAAHESDAPNEPSAISPAWQAKEGWTALELPYWPRYVRLNPTQRWMYLSWLASGRRELPSEDGYLFLYFYGLERRALVEGADIKFVVQEVHRLRALHAAQPERGRSFQRYSAGLLWHLVASKPEGFTGDAVRVLADGTAFWGEDALAAALSWFASTGAALPAWMARIVAQQLPTSVRSVIVRRVPREFDTLFKKRFEEAHPGGMKLRVSKQPLRSAYRPASDALNIVSATAPNPMGIPSQFKDLSDIWNACVEELRKFSAVAADAGEGLTAKAWESMPTELREGVDHPLAGEFNRLVNAASATEGGPFVRIGALAAAAGIESRPTLTVKQSRELASTAEHVGYCLEPDPRITGAAYPWDQLVAVFLRMDDTQPDVPRYAGAACMLQLGMSIAAADGEAAEAETAIVTSSIDSSFHLTDHERRRLEALRDLITKTGADAGGLAKRLQESLRPEQRASVGKLLVAIAGADGRVSNAEVKALRKAYRTLGLEPTALDQTLAGIAAGPTDEPVTVRPASAGTGRSERIPPPPGEEVGAGVAELRLDRAAVAAIMAETREVAELLAKAMNVEETEESSTHERAPAPVARPASSTLPPSGMTSAPPVTPTSTLSGLAARYQPVLAELLTRDIWSAAEAAEMARRHGMPVSGAIEAINDWALESTGSPLLHEDGDQVVLDRTALP